MGRLIDADKLSADMYHEAFVKDSDMQKWDSGCWIRYKMFENVLKAQSTVEPEVISKWKKEFREYVDSLDIARDDWKGIIEYIDELPSAQPDIIHCKDCAYCDSDVVDAPYGMTKKIFWCDRLYAGANENLVVDPDDFCSWAERREK